MDLIHSYHHAGEYASCFTELQRDFIVSRPTKLKSLIRLVKHWYQQVGTGPGSPWVLGGEETGPALARTLGWWSRKLSYL